MQISKSIKILIPFVFIIIIGFIGVYIYMKHAGLSSYQDMTSLNSKQSDTNTTGTTSNSEDSKPTHRNLIFTSNDNNTTVTLHNGDEFLLELDSHETWNVQIADEAVLEKIQSNSLIDAGQGIYRAKNVGKTNLQAEGLPVCPKNELCPNHTLRFNLNIVVN